eukprot:410897_1
MDSTFARIDKALAEYYTNCGRTDYYNKNAEGKFVEFVRKNQFDEEQIDLELGDNLTANECSLLGFDNEFPVMIEEKPQIHRRGHTIFEILKCCYKYGSTSYPINPNGTESIYQQA